MGNHPQIIWPRDIHSTMSRFSVARFLTVGSVIVRGLTPCTVEPGQIVGCSASDVCTKELVAARKCCMIIGNCYKDKRYNLSPAPVENMDKYNDCMEGNRRIQMLGYRNRLVDCKKHLSPPVQKPKVTADVKCINAKVKLLYAAFGFEEASQPVCKTEQKAEVFYVKSGNNESDLKTGENDANSSGGVMGTSRKASGWYSDYYVPRSQKCREISEALAGLQGFQSLFGGMNFSGKINSRYAHYQSEYE